MTVSWYTVHRDFSKCLHYLDINVITNLKFFVFISIKFLYIFPALHIIYMYLNKE